VRVGVWRWMRLISGLVFTLVCLWMALRHVRIDGLKAVLRGVQWSWLGLALGSLSAGYTVRIYRWWWMLRFLNPRVLLRSCVGPLIAGVAINNVMPFRAGDALRVLGFQQQLDTPSASLLASLLIERILDLTVLVGIFLIGLLGLKPHGIPAVYLHTASVLVAMGVLGWALLLFLTDPLRSLLRKLAHNRVLTARDWSSRVELQIERLFLALNIVRAPGRALRLLILSAVVWACEGAILVFVAQGLHYQGAPLGPWFAMAIGSLSTLIPSTPGYVGTFDFFTISGLLAYGASASAAAAVAFIAHAVLWLPLTATGVTYLLLVYPARLRNPFAAATSAARGQERT